MRQAGASKSRVTDIYTTLFDRIVNAEYNEGSWLREDAVAREFGVSRSPIRSVFRQLHQDGMLELVPKRGAQVFPFTADDIEEIYEIRKALETLAVSLGIHNLSIQRLFSLRKQMTDLLQEDDPRPHIEIDGIFHTYLIESSHRRRLVYMINGLYRLIQSLRERGMDSEATRRATIEEHCAIIDALTTRDAAAASHCLVQHIQNSKSRLLTEIVRQRPGLSLTR